MTDLENRQSMWKTETEKLLYRLNDLSSSIHTLAKDVKRDAESLAELRVQLATMVASFTELAKLVRNGNPQSLLNRVNTLEVLMREHLSSFNTKQRNRYYATWVFVGAVLGASLPAIIDFIRALIEHLAN
jgi:hypothetical protein